MPQTESHFNSVVNSLNQSEQERVLELIGALRRTYDEVINPQSDLMTPEFVQEIRSRLLTQHYFIGSPLTTETFDAAFIAACDKAGRKVNFDPGATSRFWDTEVDGEKVSLKSSKAKGLRDSTLHISKLTEAAWIQDCRTATKRHEYTMELFKLYLNTVDRMYQLRYFVAKAKYELVEIPMGLLANVLTVPVAEFNADGPTIGIPVGQKPPDLVLVLDRSDAKITLRHILKSRCIVHATWTLETEPDPTE